MTKKEYVLQLLTKLQQAWREYADGLLLIIEQTDVEQSVVDGLYTIISLSVDEVLDADTKAILERWKTILQKIAYVEAQEKEHLDEELDQLLQQL